jgi:hypothetical protein
MFITANQISITLVKFFVFCFFFYKRNSRQALTMAIQWQYNGNTKHDPQTLVVTATAAAMTAEWGTQSHCGFCC